MRWPCRRLGAAAAVFDERGRVLLVKHTYGPLNWELPGGTSEPEESVIGTALRELREETGVDAVAESLTGIYWNPEDDVHNFVFRCRVDDGGDPVPTSPEISECAFWDTADLPRPISDFTVRRVVDAVSKSPQPLPITVPDRTILR